MKFLCPQPCWTPVTVLLVLSQGLSEPVQPQRRVVFSSGLQNKKSRSKAQGQSKNLALPAPWSDMGSGRGAAKALMGTARSLGRNNCPGVSSAPWAAFPWLHQPNPPSAMPTHAASKVTPTRAALQGSFGSGPDPAPPEHPKFPPAPLFSLLRKDERALGRTLLVCPFCETANSPSWNPALGGHAKSPDSSQGCLQTLGIFILKANSISHPAVCKFEASSLLRDGSLPSKGRSAQWIQLIFGWLDIAKKAPSSSAKNTRENLCLSISLGSFPLVSAGFRFFPKKSRLEKLPFSKSTNTSHRLNF